MTDSLFKKTKFRNIFILDSRNWFASCQDKFDPTTDLVLTYDLALKHEIASMGGQAFYVDHLIDNQAMQENNFLIYDFFRTWHFDAEDKDIFTYKGVPFGFSFRIEFWNDFVFYVRARLCLEKLRDLKFTSLFVGTKLGLIESILDEMQIGYSQVQPLQNSQFSSYYFPIHRWMDEHIRANGLKAKILNLLIWGSGTLLFWHDRLCQLIKRKPAVFVQQYHPTRQILSCLEKNKKLRTVLVTISKSAPFSRYIPIRLRPKKFQAIAEKLMATFRSKRNAKLILSNGIDVSESIYKIIDKKISSLMSYAISTLDSIIYYLDKNPIHLEVLTSNIGDTVTLLDCVCKAKGIPSYMIINGILGNEFLDEAKYATVINAYSTSIKANYFRGMNNIVCLGDPRMDNYPVLKQPRIINREFPTITIGASGHNNTDLNSYVAVEFDFIFDVLQALSQIKKQGQKIHVIIKVRPNGYIEQYRNFTNEFFPGLVDEIVDNVTMSAVLEKTDFYISIYSQTHFEASCLGIPCLYYKKDNEVIYPPFDGKSELVTVGCVDDLVEAITDFRSGHSRFDPFLNRVVMEKYIGPLDGKNLERNLNFIYDLLSKQEKGCAC